MADSGAHICTIPSDIVSQLPEKCIKRLENKARFVLGVANKLEPIRGRYLISFQIDGIDFEAIFHEIASCNKILLGLDFLTTYEAVYDFGSRTLALNGETFALQGAASKTSLAKIDRMTVIEPHTAHDVDITLSRPVRSGDTYHVS